MKHVRQHGYSLIELMIATSLAVITALVALQVASNFQLRRVTTSGKNDAVVAAAVALYTIERELRMAGAGLIGSGGLTCKAGFNLNYDGAVVRDGEALAPVIITDGGTGPDTIEYLRTDVQGSSSGAPANIIGTMASADAALQVDRVDGLKTGDLYMAASSDGNKICTLYQMSSDPVADVNAFQLRHVSGTSGPYNPENAAVFSNPIAYEVGDKVINLGSQPISAFSIACTTTAPPTCDLLRYAPIETQPAVGEGNAVASQIVDLQAQYGVAAVGSQSISEWVDATGATWQSPTVANFSRIKAMRVAIVARGEYDAAVVSPEKLTLWSDPPTGQVLAASQLDRTLTTEERHYRYTVLTTIVPLINIIQAGL
jgi:type IV pilus assembly protein PilW